MNFIYDPRVETLSAEQIADMQTAKFREHLAYCRKNSPFYRPLLKEFDAEHFTLDMLPQLPFTTKEQLSRDPRAFQSCPDSEIHEIVFTSGTTGEPCPFEYTQNDLDRTGYNEERAFRAAGITSADRILLTCTIDRCFIAGMAYWLGGTRVGASMLRNGLSSLESHLWIIRRIRPTVVIGIASFLKKLGVLAKTNGVPLDSVKKMILIGEPIRNDRLETNEMGLSLAEEWPSAELFATYASTEIVTSFTECPCHCGGHLLADLAYAEIIGEDGKVLPDGEIGEVVITPFSITGMPLVRYRTGDVSFRIGGRCRCGRWSPRLGPILGRKSQLLKFRGTSIYPQVIFNTLSTISEIDNYYVVASGDNLSDRVTVVVSLKKPDFPLDEIQHRLQVTCRANLPVVSDGIREVNEKVFGTSRKPMHFFDERRNFRR